MFGSAILEVAIGVMFVYLLLSLFCSALSELIESFVKFRAHDLKKGIENLLHGRELARDFFDHPLIKPLGENPSYIPAHTFSLALWNMATTEASAGRQAEGLMQNMDLIKEWLASLDDGKYKAVKVSLMILLDQAENDIGKAQANIEEWYNDAMDRVSGWYKRRVQWMLIVIGLLTAASLNVDTISVARILWYDDTLRASFVVAAENYLGPPSAPAQTPSQAPAAAGQVGQVVLAAPSKPATVSSPQTASTPDNVAAAMQATNADLNDLQKINEIRDEINRLDLPIGWVSAPSATNSIYEGLKEAEAAERYKHDLAAYQIDPRRIPRGFNEWFLKVIGIFITALAISQGAPFWFDLLNRLVTLRSTVKPGIRNKQK
ncbi:MAG: hypothetical protein J2P31_05845 [Blastocatellia bacterium]|nr:hypothetical protein [Blastocatellia bacterium]